MTNRSVRHIVSAAALVALAGVASAQQGPFTGHVVVRVYPKTPAQLTRMRSCPCAARALAKFYDLASRDLSVGNAQ